MRRPRFGADFRTGDLLRLGEGSRLRGGDACLLLGGVRERDRDELYERLDRLYLGARLRGGESRRERRGGEREGEGLDRRRPLVPPFMSGGDRAGRRGGDRVLDRPRGISLRGGLRLSFLRRGGEGDALRLVSRRGSECEAPRFVPRRGGVLDRLRLYEPLRDEPV